jgi:hypothetical protein
MRYATSNRVLTSYLPTWVGLYLHYSRYQGSRQVTLCSVVVCQLPQITSTSTLHLSPFAPVNVIVSTIQAILCSSP